MSKQKSIFVTAIMAVMLAVITFAAYRLSMPVFIVLVGILSAVGFASAAIMFCKWLQKPSEREEDDLDVAAVGMDEGISILLLQSTR